MSRTENWSRNWKSSTNPSKQRKYRRNAPLHVKDKLVSVNTSKPIREELNTRSIPVRVGDQVKVMRGDHRGQEGIVSQIDRDEQKVYIHGVVVERTDGTERQIAMEPSNLQVTALTVEDEYRMEKYDIDDFEAIRVEEDEKEEALEEDEEGEMMKQMQTGESSLEASDDEDEEDDTISEDEETEEDETNYQQIVSQNIADAKDTLKDLDEVDWEQALQAEKDNKNRTTFTDWLESKSEE